MHRALSTEVASGNAILREFKRREYLPMLQDLLWKIDKGSVRTLTLHEDGTNLTLGLWGAGDIVGLPLAGIEPYQIECLSKVQAHRLRTDECASLDQALFAHVRQSQALLSIRHGSVLGRLERFFLWLAERFGTECAEGCRLSVQLTHQDIAEIIGSSRVTVTRMIGELERAGLIAGSNRDRLLRRDFYSPSPASLLDKRCTAHSPLENFLNIN
ncbi:MAG: Crp/Fnr family transcriptional regulator [Cyanobacteria bacterium P01_A01_bin.17]